VSAHDRPTETSTSADGLGLRIIDADGAIELVVSGELDLSESGRLEEELTRALEQLGRTGDTPTRLVVDLESLRFIDSSGIHVLVGARRRADRQGVDLSVRIGDSPVRRMLRLAGVAEFLGLD
jgi:anti-anti-sigma factor